MVNAQVPLVGLPLRAFQVFAVVTVQCQCDERNEPMMLLGVTHSLMCPRCRAVYAITALHYERGKTERVQAAVALVGRGVET